MTEKNDTTEETAADKNLSVTNEIQTAEQTVEEDVVKDTEEESAADQEVSTVDNEETPTAGEESETPPEEEKRNEETEIFIKNLKETDFNSYSKEELFSSFKDILSVSDIALIKDVAEDIKNIFYKKYRTEVDEKRAAFIEDGGLIEDFKYQDAVEVKFKELYQKYKEKKALSNAEQEREKKENLKLRQEIIEEIKELINKEESIGQTFKEFRVLQDRWKEIGMIPQSEVKDIWETYHHNVSQFYDYIKINKELRDLDLKKNLEAKIALCEQAEALILEETVVKAFAALQQLHDQWRETGPVPQEKKDELWQRFKNATSQINKRHQDYFLNLKEQEKKNLEAKRAICEKIEDLLKKDMNTPKYWTEASKEIIELQKVWRTIGFAPKKYNTEIYDRFRQACDLFFNKKREFFQVLKSGEEENKQKKIDLCIQAEALQDSTAWKETTTQLIAIQKEWKTIGPIPRKDSDKLWKRFRSACDKFFDEKEKHFSKLDGEQEENLTKKLALIEELKALEFGDNLDENLAMVQNIQKQWSEIGFIPLKQKDKVNSSFMDALSKRYEELKIDDEKKKILKYKVKLEGLKNAKQTDGKVRIERNKLLNKLKTLENDVVLLENNIGFFSNTNNAESLIKDVEKKIEKGKKEIEVIKKQIKLLDNIDDED